MSVSRVKTSSILQGFPKSRSLLAGNPFYVPPSFESIATTTPSGVSSVTFSSIPTTYQHLQIRVIGRTTTAQTEESYYVRFNSISSGYGHFDLYGNSVNTTPEAMNDKDVNDTNIILHRAATGASATSNLFGHSIIDIDDYNSTAKNKNLRHFGGNLRPADSQGSIWLTGGLSTSTSAITSISITLASGNFVSGSSVCLYGIKN
jgi:hypothetical protein